MDHPEYAPITWILLRGLARERGHWGPFVEDFARARGPRETVLAIDLPGTGEFTSVPSPRTLGELAAFVRDRARERDPRPGGGSFHLLTISLGAMVGLAWLRDHPADVAGLVAINASVAGLSPFYHRLRWQVWRRFAELAAKQVPRDRERILVDLLINDPAAQARALATWSKLAQERPIPGLTFANQLWAALRGGGRPITHGRPGLILSGLGDRFVDPSCAAELARAVDWPIARHPWAGHDLPWDDPAWVIARVNDWHAPEVSPPTPE